MATTRRISSTLVASVLANNLHHEDLGLFVLCLWHALRLPVPTDVQIDIARYLQNGPRRRMVKAFRGVGKSWLTAAYVLWCLLRDRNERILVVSASRDRAVMFTRFVRRLIDDVEWLNHLAPVDGQTDTVEAFEVAGAEPSQSPSVKSASITGQITGSRATIIVADDIEVPRNAQTVKLREQLAAQVTEFDAVLLPGGEIIYLGTDQTEMSLYKQLPARGYDVRVWPARVPLVDKVAMYGSTLGPHIAKLLDDGVQAWAPSDPERFDHHDLLEREASYGRSGFAMQFMLDPSLGDAERYPLRCSDLVVLDVQPNLVPTQLAWGTDPKLQVIQDLDCLGLTGDRWHRPMYVGDKWTEPQERVMFVDPSGRGQDETAAAVVANFGPTLFVLDVDGWMDGYSDATLRAIVEMAKRTQTQLVIVEPTFGGGMYTETLRRAFAQHGYPCTVQDGEYPRNQKEMRIIDTLEPVMVQHRLVIGRRVVERDLAVAQARAERFGTERASDYQLVYQLTRITRDRDSLRHDDRLEALAGAVGHFAQTQAQTELDAAQSHRDHLMDLEVEKFLREFEGREPENLWNSPR